MNNAAALHELNRALAQFRRSQASAPTPHSAREIAQMSLLTEYLYASHDFIQTQTSKPRSSEKPRRTPLRVLPNPLPAHIDTLQPNA